MLRELDGDPFPDATTKRIPVSGTNSRLLRSPVDGAIVLGIQEFPLVTSGSWVAELGILVPE